MGEKKKRYIFLEFATFLEMTSLVLVRSRARIISRVIFKHRNYDSPQPITSFLCIFAQASFRLHLKDSAVIKSTSRIKNSISNLTMTARMYTERELDWKLKLRGNERGENEKERRDFLFSPCLLNRRLSFSP